MKRVAVVGPSGAGKSTFSRTLAASTGLPLVHLDEHFWKPGWVESTKEEWRAAQAELIAEPQWILDGNYGGTMDLRLPAADTLIIIGLHRMRCLFNATRRVVLDRSDLQAPGCPNRMTWEFAQYIWNYPTGGRVRLGGHIANYGSHLRIIECTTRREAQSLLDRLAS